MTTICLCMIVRNEAHVIRRRLESVKPYITKWCICDTGSNDGTQVIIRDFLRGREGMLYEHPCRDFAWNRSRALDGARTLGCAYALVIDADEVLQVHDPSALIDLREAAYLLMLSYTAVSHPTLRVLRMDLDWHYVGVIHEVAECTGDHDHPLLTGVELATPEDGRRSQTGYAAKARRDLVILEQAVQDEPENRRYLFFYAQTLRIAGRIEDSIAAYRKRAGMGGYKEEVWYSRYQIAIMSMLTDRWKDAVQFFTLCAAEAPWRAEPWLWLACRYLPTAQTPPTSQSFAHASPIKKFSATMPLAHPIYDHQAALYRAICLANLGRQDESNAIITELVEEKRLPAEIVVAPG